MISTSISSQAVVDKPTLVNEENLESKLGELASRVVALKKSELSVGEQLKYTTRLLHHALQEAKEIEKSAFTHQTFLKG